MSSNTPDSAHDTSEFVEVDMHASDSEPSMEDILSSIRQIIADDKTESSIDIDASNSEGVSVESLAADTP